MPARRTAHGSVEEAASRIAGAVGEPARARMLFGLLDGRARTSTELALVANVSPSTASAHLARLRDERLVDVHVQGRHRYYRIENRRVAAMLERLAVLAGDHTNERTGERAAPFRASTPDHLVHARTCYDHIAGALGVALHDALVARDWVDPDGARGSVYAVTESGARQLAALGVDLDQLHGTRRRLAFGCLDWSERRPHLGGALGAILLATMLEKRWVRGERHSRALGVTALGRRELASRLGVRIDG